jgi:hypothetical protein
MIPRIIVYLLLALLSDFVIVASLPWNWWTVQDALPAVSPLLIGWKDPRILGGRMIDVCD